MKFKICIILEAAHISGKVLQTKHKQIRGEMLPFALHGYQTYVRTSTGATPFSLVYRMKVVLPFEVEIPSLRTLAELRLEEAKWAQSRLTN